MAVDWWQNIPAWLSPWTSIASGTLNAGKGMPYQGITTPTTGTTSSSNYTSNQSLYRQQLEGLLRTKTDNTDDEIATILAYADSLLSQGYLGESLPLWNELGLADYFTQQEQAGMQVVIPGKMMCDANGGCYDLQGRKLSDDAANQLIQDAYGETESSGMTDYQQAQLDLAVQELNQRRSEANAQLGLDYAQLGLERDQWLAGLQANPSDWIEKWFAAAGYNPQDYGIGTQGRGNRGMGYGGGTTGQEYAGTRWDYGYPNRGIGKVMTPADISQGAAGPGLYDQPRNFNRYNDVLAGGTMAQAKELGATGWIGNVNPAIIQAQPEYQQIMQDYENKLDQIVLSSRAWQQAAAATGQSPETYTSTFLWKQLREAFDADRLAQQMRAANAAVEGISARTQQGLPTITPAPTNQGYTVPVGAGAGAYGNWSLPATQQATTPTPYTAPVVGGYSFAPSGDIVGGFSQLPNMDVVGGYSSLPPSGVDIVGGFSALPSTIGTGSWTAPTYDPYASTGYYQTPTTGSLQPNWGYSGVSTPYTGDLGLTPSQQAIRQISSTTANAVANETGGLDYGAGYAEPVDTAKMEAKAQIAYRNALAAAQTYGDQSPEYLSALKTYQKYAQYYMGGNPVAPPWLSQFVEGTATGLPVSRSANITTPSGQQWYATPESVKQGLASFADYSAGTLGAAASMQDIIDQMNIMRSKGIGSTNWTPAYQYA